MCLAPPPPQSCQKQNEDQRKRDQRWRGWKHIGWLASDQRRNRVPTCPALPRFCSGLIRGRVPSMSRSLSWSPRRWRRGEPGRGELLYLGYCMCQCSGGCLFCREIKVSLGGPSPAPPGSAGLRVSAPPRQATCFSSGRSSVRGLLLLHSSSV